MMASSLSPPPAKLYALSVQGVPCVADSSELLGVAFKGSVSPLPWSTQGVSGLVDSEWGPIAFLNTLPPAEACAQAGGGEALMAVVRAAKGLIAIESSHVHGYWGEQPSDGGVPLLAHLATAIEGLSQEHLREAQVPVVHKPIAAKTATFLRVVSGGVGLAVPADRVFLLDKHQGARPISPGQSLEWVVKLDGDLVGAQSLAALLHLAPPVGGEPWCLCLDEPAHHRGLLVEQVMGLLAVDVAQIKVLQRPDGASTWLILPDEEPLQVLSDARAAVHESSIGGQGVRPGSGVVDRPETGGAKARVLSLKVGPYQVAIAGEMVRTVLGTLGDGILLSKRRASGGSPVLDLAQVFDVHVAMACRFAVVVQLGQSDVVLLCERAEFSESSDPFWPLPAVPSQVNEVFQSVRLLKNRCELLLRNDLSNHEWRRLVKKMPSNSFTGWLSANSKY